MYSRGNNVHCTSAIYRRGNNLQVLHTGKQLALQYITRVFDELTGECASKIQPLVKHNSLTPPKPASYTTYGNNMSVEVRNNY